MSAASCPNRNAELQPQEIADGWCESCGKRVPSFITREAGGPSYKPSYSLPSYPPEYDERSFHYRDRTPLASRLSRLGAAILDNVFALLLLAPGYVILLASEDQDDVAAALFGLALMLGGLVILLGVQITLLTMHGQSLGKKVVGVRIVRMEDDSNPGFVGAVLLRWFVPGLIGAVPCIGPIFNLVDILCIFGEERRCLHDQIAGTKVVEA